MSIDLTPETERLVSEEIRNGHFRSVDDLIVSGVNAWREKYGSVPASPTTSPAAVGRAATADLAGLKDRSERDLKHQQALHWLSENRQSYAGQWIALQGSQLVAAGKTAKEVYSQVPKEHPPALVIRIEKEDLPFGGW